MSKTLQAQLAKTLKEQGDLARDMALAELKDMKKDLLNLEKALASKKTPDQALLMDITHGAFELFRTASIVLETDTLQEHLNAAQETGRDLDYLEKKGALLLTKPEGWHWFSPKGEMTFLAPPGDTQLAASKLKERLTKPSRTTKKQPAKTKSAPAKPIAENT